MQPTTIKIASIGGGTGHSISYIALRHILSWIQLMAEFPGDLLLRRISRAQSRRLNHLLSQFTIEGTALVGAWDSGGSVGQLRKTIGASGSTADVTKIYGALANPEGFVGRLSDYLPLLCKALGKTFGPEAIQSLYDLAGIDPSSNGDPATQSLKDRLRHRYAPDDPRPIFRGNTIQNMAAASLWKQLLSGREGLETYHKLIGAPKEFRVLPLSWESAKLGVKYQDGTEGWDEATIDQRPEKDREFDPHLHRVKSYQLDPDDICICSDADEAIRTADILVCPPGSVANQGGAFQVRGVQEAVLNRFGPGSQKDGQKTGSILIMNLSAAPPDSQYETALTLKEKLQGIYGIAFDNIICNNDIIPNEAFRGCAEPLDIHDLVKESLVEGSATSTLFTGLVSEEALLQGRVEHDPYLLALTLIPLFAKVAARKRARKQKGLAGTLA